MNVVESREGRPLRLRPWVLLVGAAVVVAVIAIVFAVGGSSPSSSGPGSATGGTAGHGSGSGSGGSGGSASFSLQAVTPAAGTQNVPPNTPITLTFSKPVSLQKAAPTLSPSIAGKWV
jgi:Bacterial Ig-like domain